jgi:hypothetical protein
MKISPYNENQSSQDEIMSKYQTVLHIKYASENV